MPLIKDKYKAKGVSLRSKFVTRQINRAVQSDTIPQNVLSTEQKQSQISNTIRAASAPVTTATEAIGISSSPIAKASITGVKLAEVAGNANIVYINGDKANVDLCVKGIGFDVNNVPSTWAPTLSTISCSLATICIFSSKNRGRYRRPATAYLLIVVPINNEPY